MPEENHLDTEDYAPESGAEAIEAIRARLGEVVLLPIEKGNKGPFFDGWQQLTVPECRAGERELVWYKGKGKARKPWKRAAYAEELQRSLDNGGNLGVLLAGNLCAIDIDNDADVERFLELNPALRQTLITRGARGVQIWIRCLVDQDRNWYGFFSWPHMKPIKEVTRWRNAETGRMEESKENWGEWRAATEKGAQSIIWGQHPSGVRYRWLTDEPVREVYFHEIVWPAKLELPWRADWWLQLADRFGPPWGHEDGQIKGCGDPFWTGKFFLEHDIIYETDECRFYQYSSLTGAWHKKSDEEIQVMLADDMLNASKDPKVATLVCNDSGSQLPGWRRISPGGLAALAGRSFRSSGQLASIVRLLKGVAAKREIFTQGTGVVHLQNGMLNLKEQPLRIRGFSPKYYSRNPIPLEYVAGAECRVFKEELLEAALPEDDIDLLQRWGGLLLLGRNFPQKLMILTGTAGGGKSTVMKIFQMLVGQINVAQLRTEQLKERFELFAYVGKTFLSGVDVPGNFLMKAGSYVIKGLTGGDLLQAEVKGGKDFITIEGHYNIGITCNGRLKVKLDADSEAWRRRLCIISYEKEKPKKARDDFAEWLVEKEGPGILLWMIGGALKVLAGDRLNLSKAQQGRVDDLLDESDSIRVFLQKQVVAARGEHLLSEDISERYFDFCEEIGWDGESRRVLERELPDLMLEMFRAKRSSSLKDENDKSAKGYRGVTWKPEEAATPEPPGEEKF